MPLSIRQGSKFSLIRAPVLEALPGKLDIIRHSPSILYLDHKIFFEYLIYVFILNLKMYTS